VMAFLGRKAGPQEEKVFCFFSSEKKILLS
jgi:hypothetical protein